MDPYWEQTAKLSKQRMEQKDSQSNSEQGSQPNTERQLLAVEAPVDMWRTWRTEEDIGKDWEEEPEPGAPSPLLDRQESFLNSDLISEVEFGEKLGSGSFGEVFKCIAFARTPKIERRNEWVRNMFACKVIRPQSRSIEDIELSLNDMRILRYLRHENICNLFEIIGIPDRRTTFPYAVVCMFFELCDGTLHQLLLQKNPNNLNIRPVFTETQSRHWFAQIARGLEYIHRNNVVHRDLKARNILYQLGAVTTNQFEDRFFSCLFKICDFGESRDVLQRGLQITWSEQDHRAAEFDDVEGLGRVLFDLGITVPVKRNKNLPEFRYGELYETLPEQWEGYSPELRDLLIQMELRFSSSQVLQHPWLQNNTDERTEKYIMRAGIVQEEQSQYEPFGNDRYAAPRPKYQYD